MTEADQEGRPPHPGRIAWVDGATGKILSEEPADEFPDSVRYAHDAEGRLRPVVRLVVTGSGNRREIAQVDADGTVLRRTYQTRQG
jgi:hypothetical protein